MILEIKFQGNEETLEFKVSYWRIYMKDGEPLSIFMRPRDNAKITRGIPLFKLDWVKYNGRFIWPSVLIRPPEKRKIKLPQI